VLLLQIVGLHTRQTNRVDCARGTTMSSWSADRNRERAATVCTGVYTSRCLQECTHNGVYGSVHIVMCTGVYTSRCVQECAHQQSTSEIGRENSRTSSAQYWRWCAV